MAQEFKSTCVAIAADAMTELVSVAKEFTEEGALTQPLYNDDGVIVAWAGHSFTAIDGNSRTRTLLASALRRSGNIDRLNEFMAKVNVNSVPAVPFESAHNFDRFVEDLGLHQQSPLDEPPGPEPEPPA